MVGLNRIPSTRIGGLRREAYLKFNMEFRLSDNQRKASHVGIVLKYDVRVPVGLIARPLPRAFVGGIYLREQQYYVPQGTSGRWRTTL